MRKYQGQDVTHKKEEIKKKVDMIQEVSEKPSVNNRTGSSQRTWDSRADPCGKPYMEIFLESLA